MVKKVIGTLAILTLFLLLVFEFGSTPTQVDASVTIVESPTISVELPFRTELGGEGGIVAADVNDDSRVDLLITKRDEIFALSTTGHILWRVDANIHVTELAEVNGLPGWHAPGIQTADLDQDGRTEVLYLTHDGDLQVLDGSSGVSLYSFSVPPPPGSPRWEHLVVANFRGRGDTDLLLQTTNGSGVRRGRYLSAYALGDLISNRDRYLCGPVTTSWLPHIVVLALPTWMEMEEMKSWVARF